MNKDSCIAWPEVNGKPSKLYKDLLSQNKSNRPFVNWIYASYLSSDAADIMDAAGYKRDSRGEHSAADVSKFFKINEMLAEVNKLSIEEQRYGIIDDNQNRVDFADAKVALELADSFNKDHKGLVATVVQHGDVYQVVVSQKNARTHTDATEVEQKLKIWDAEKQAFNAVGVNIENMPQELKTTFSPYNLELANRLSNLQKTAIENLYRKDALILFNLDANSVEVQRVINAFGSIDEAAQALNDINHGATGYTNAKKLLLKRAVEHAKNYNGLDINALVEQVAQMSDEISEASPETSIQATLHQLNKQYKIGINEVHRINNEINFLSEAAAEAAITIQRQIRKVEKEQGNLAEGRRLERIQNQLLNELSNKRYYSGILNTLSEAANTAAEIDNMLAKIPQSANDLEKAFDAARILQDVKTLHDQYYPLVSALADEHLTIDEAIGQEDIDNIRNSAKKLLDFLDKKEKVIQKLVKNTMTDLLTQIIGDTAPNGQSIANIIEMAAVDSSIYDYLYSVGRVSNPIIAAMGSIIRNAELSRNPKMNDISLRIRRATNKLYKSGSTSDFMYEDEGHIISDIDWKLYKSARTGAIKAFYQQGLRSYDLKEAIASWEEQNTEDRVVDKTNGRTEKVPDSKYRKAFPTLTKAQQEYYDEMMQLKGELGSLLPSYAQKQYLPPQVRREMLDAIGAAKNAKDVASAIGKKIANLWKIREDDINYNMNGIIDGDEYRITEGAFDNTPLRQIPIFFVNPVESGELVRNFSTGIAALAGTAVNYEAMNNVAQVVEFMGDFIKDQAATEDLPKADMVQNKAIRVFKDLVKHGKNNNTIALVDGFIDQHIYGLRQKDQGTWSKFWNNIIAYTSFKGLATNVKGAFSNYLVGEFQMLIEAGAGEFYGIKDYAWAHLKLFGGSGVAGELSELLTNNMNHKATLFREMFDPIQENYSDKSSTKYYKSMFRQLVGHDCSFIGYASGEYLIHYVNMYAILHNQKMLLNGKKISMFDAFEVTKKQDGNSELKLKDGVTMLDGSEVTPEFIETIKEKIRYANQTTHGSMNAEDKGLLHQRWWGRGVMNFRQWMVEHYSRRFRTAHFDDSLGMTREGYWVTFWNTMYKSEKTKEAYEDEQVNAAKAIGMFMRDFVTFAFRAQSQWNNLDETQKYNVKRVISEMTMYIALLGLSFALGEPEEHKKEWWRRWWIYQVRRLMLDTEASMPHPKAISSGLTILQSPMAGVNTLNSLLYTFTGLPDIAKTIKSGDHKGENKYWRNFKKYNLPFFKDWEQMQKLADDEAIFQIFENNPSNY